MEHFSIFQFIVSVLQLYCFISVVFNILKKKNLINLLSTIPQADTLKLDSHQITLLEIAILSFIWMVMLQKEEGRVGTAMQPDVTTYIQLHIPVGLFCNVSAIFHFFFFFLIDATKDKTVASVRIFQTCKKPVSVSVKVFWFLISL